MSYNEGKKAFKSSSPVSGNRVLMLDGSTGLVTHHDGAAASLLIGFSEERQIDDHVNVKLRNCPGTVELSATGAIGVGADVFAAADGQIQALPAGAGSYLKVGVAISVATSADSVIEVLPVEPQTVTVS